MNRGDYKCRICLSILIKPVILPCSHEFCLECFEKHLNITSGSCPLCRRRVGTWARQAKKNKELVSELRWQSIQRNFPQLVNRRLNNLDTSDTETDIDIEFVMEKKTDKKDLETKEEVVMDEIKEIASSSGSCAKSRVLSPADKPGCSGVAQLNVSTEPIPISEPVKQRPKRSASAESVDSISPELNHFRPIKSEPKTPPRLAPQEPLVLKPCFMIAKPRNLTAELSNDACSRPFPTPLTCLLPRWLRVSSSNNYSTKFRDGQRCSLKKSEKSAMEVSNQGVVELKTKVSDLKKRKRRASELSEMSKNIVTEKRSTTRKRQQEMEDYKLALKIQKNINRGLYNVDRSCSGGSPYFLRRRNPQRS